MFTRRCRLEAGAAELKPTNPVRAAVLQRVRVLAMGLEVLGGTRQKQQREPQQRQVTPSSDASVPMHFFPFCSRRLLPLCFTRAHKNKLTSSDKSTAAAEKLHVCSCPTCCLSKTARQRVTAPTSCASQQCIVEDLEIQLLCNEESAGEAGTSLYASHSMLFGAIFGSCTCHCPSGNGLLSSCPGVITNSVL